MITVELTPRMKSCRGSHLDPLQLTSSTSAPSARSGGAVSAAGEAFTRFPATVARLRTSGVRVVLTGIRANVYDVLQRASLAADGTHLYIRPSLRDGVELAGTIAAQVTKA